MNGIRLYLRFIAIHMQTKLEYPISFLMLCGAVFISSLAELVGTLALFDRFETLMGFTLPEVALMYGIIKTSLSIGDGLGRGFDQFSGLVKNGDFDLVLMRPRSTALQVAGQEIQLIRLGMLVQGLLVTFWALYALNIPLMSARTALTTFAVIGGACLFYGLFVIQATLAFWTTETLEMMNILTFGGADLGQYPISIYNPSFRRFFTFVIPIGCITYFPLLTILDRSGDGAWAGWVSPLAGVVFLVLSLAFWNVGVRHYRSTGS